MSLKPGYKQTDIGVIPDDWEVKILGDIGESLIGLTYAPADVAAEGTLVLRSSNIQNDRLTFDDNVYVRSAIPQRIMVQEGDLLICVRNGSRDLIGKCAVIDDRAVGATFGAFMAVFRSRRNHFVSHQFQSHLVKKQINEHLGATINQITNRSLNSFCIPFPASTDEQVMIAEALSDVDALINSLEALLIKKRNIKTGVMQELLTGRTRLPGFTGDWQIRKLKDVAELLSGGTPSTAVAAYWGGGIPWCTPTDITSTKGNFITSTEQTITAEGVKSSSATILPVGSILLCTRATIGEAKITTVAMTTNQGFKSLVVRAGVSNIFMYFLMSTKKRVLLERSSGSTFLEISKKELGSIDLWMPEFGEQKAVASVLSDMDDEIEALEKRLAKTRDLKQGMAQELLTGRTRLV